MRTRVVDAEMLVYLAAAKEELSDLPDERQQEVLDDLAQMLLEVSAEIDGDVRDLLGPPEQLVAEVRATAGLTDSSPGASSASADKSQSMAGDDPARNTCALMRLRPAWWVLRGLALAMGLAWVTSHEPHFAWWLLLPVPLVFGSALVGALTSLAGMAASFRLGTAAESGRRRGLAVLVNVIALLVLIGTVSTVKERSTWIYADTPGAAYVEIERDPEGFSISMAELDGFSELLASQGVDLPDAIVADDGLTYQLRAPNGTILVIDSGVLNDYLADGRWTRFSVRRPQETPSTTLAPEVVDP